MAIRVLVVDDSALMRKQLSTLLSEAGFEVALARNGREAVDQVIALQPDVVTLDINMPEMDGFEIAQALARSDHTSGIPVIVLTARELTAAERKRLSGKVNAIVIKGELNRVDFMNLIRRTSMG